MKQEELWEKKLSGQTIFQGKVVTVEVDEIVLSNGHHSTREVVRHSGGVAILALSAEGMVSLVEQFRYPLQEVILELPAGKLDRQATGTEAHLSAARRELREETGIVAEEMIYLGYILASPGFCDEMLHMYLAKGLTWGEAEPDEDEFLNVVTMTFDTLLEKIMSGEIVDGKTVATALKAKAYLS